MENWNRNIGIENLKTKNIVLFLLSPKFVKNI